MAPPNFICMFVCPAFTVSVLITMGQIFMKLRENVGTQIRLFVIKFHNNRFIDDVNNDVIPDFFLLFFFAKGQKFAAKRNHNYIMHRR